MNEALRRFVILLGVFALAFGVVFIYQRVRSGKGIFDLLDLGRRDSDAVFRPENYTLPEHPPLDIDDVELLGRLDAEYARLTEAVLPSVVSIDTEGVKRELLRDLFGRVWERPYPVAGIGSGVIVSKEGHVVTNQHVTDGKERITVTLYDGSSYPAVLVGEDRSLDIAVIRIESDNREFKALPFVDDSDKVQRGQLVFAIGNPFGLGETITQGIISARERSISDTQRDLFQTDAAINPGNSGGPLVNLFGEIIGINSAIYSPDTENRGFHGVGFAIPANDAREAFDQLVSRGRPIRSYLGVKILDIDGRVRRATGFQGDRGAFILDVIAKSPADHANLEPFDIVLRYNGQDISTKDHFLSLLKRTKVGEEATLRVWRSGELLNLTATLIDADEAAFAERAEPPNRSPTDHEIDRAIGLRVRRLTKLEATVEQRSVAIASVRPGSLAYQARLRPGDFIWTVNGQRMPSPDHFYGELFASAGGGQNTTIVVQRGNGRAVPIIFPPLPRTADEAGP